MPITDKTFTPEELETVLTENPDLLPVVTSTLSKKEYGIKGTDGTIKQTKFFVADNDQKSTFENNLKTQHNAELTKQVATEVEQKVFELTGIKKASVDEKWTAYYQRAMKETKDSATALQNKITDLESKSDLSVAERQQLTQLKDLQATKDAEIENLKTSHVGEVERLKIENKVYSDKGIQKVDGKLSKNPLLQDAIDIVREKVIGDIVSISKNEGGEIRLYSKDGKVLTNTDASFMTVSQYYEKQMEKYIDGGKQTGGAGGNGDDSGLGVPSGVKTQYELNIKLREQGYVAGTREFTKEFNRLGGDKLPVQ